MAKWIPVLLVLILALAGCSLLFPSDQYQDPPNEPGSLEFSKVPSYDGTNEPAEHLRRNGAYHIPIEIFYHNPGNRNGAIGEEFNNVTVIGYAKDGAELCKHRVGDIPYATDQEIVIKCSNPPWMFGMTAEESPCDDRVEIRYYFYAQTDQAGVDDEYVWQSTVVKCGETLPLTRTNNT
jgi:hypothetical protein